MGTSRAAGIGTYGYQLRSRYIIDPTTYEHDSMTCQMQDLPNLSYFPNNFMRSAEDLAEQAA